MMGKKGVLGRVAIELLGWGTPIPTRQGVSVLEQGATKFVLVQGTAIP